MRVSLTLADEGFLCFGRWLKSPSFGVWLARQEAIVQDILNTPGCSTST